MHHYILTRHGAQIREEPPTEAWVRARREHLHRVCVESLRAQTCKDFVWVVFVDEQFAEGERSWLTGIVGGDFRFRVFASPEPMPEGEPLDLTSGPSVWEQGIGPIPSGDRVITTRLDSDDGLCASFCERLRAEVGAERGPASFDFADGIIVDTAHGIPLRRPYWASSFQSLVEPIEEGKPIRTVMVMDHQHLPKMFPYKYVRTSGPMWVAVVHGENWLNQNALHGLPCAPASVPQWLSAALGEPKVGGFRRWSYAGGIGAAWAVRVLRSGQIRQRVRVAMRHYWGATDPGAIAGSSQSGV